MKPVYLDYNATTPLDPRVLEAIKRALEEIPGNASSLHRLGRAARVALDDCRLRAAGCLGCKPGEVVFTGGGTEGNNLSILGAARASSSKGRHLVTSRIEHPSVLRCFEALAEEEGFDVSYVEVGKDGIVQPEALRAVLRPDTTLVSVMAANNETGVVQPVDVIGGICRERGVTFHTDASQVVGKLALKSLDDLRADLVTLCAHKFYGPKGVGLVYVRSGTRLGSVVHGGAQEEERRPGTENVPLLMGLVCALEFATPGPLLCAKRMAQYNNLLSSCLANIPGAGPVASVSPRLPNTWSFTIQGCDNMAVLAGLDLEGICVSGGSACSTGALVPSHVVLAMGYSPAEARSFIRISAGRETQESDIQALTTALPAVVERVRAAGLGVSDSL